MTDGDQIERPLRGLRAPFGELIEWLKMLSLLAALIVGVNVLFNWRINPLSESLVRIERDIAMIQIDIRQIRESLIAAGVLEPASAADRDTAP